MKTLFCLGVLFLLPGCAASNEIAVAGLAIPGLASKAPPAEAVPGPPPKAAVSSCPRQEVAQRNMKRLIVRIQSNFPGLGAAGENGAGIVIGQENGKIYIATAAHVVEDKSLTGKQEIIVSQEGGKPVRAKQSPQFSRPGEEDVAVIEIDAPVGPGHFELPDFAVQYDPTDIHGIDTLATVGYPAAGPYTISKFAPAQYDGMKLALSAPTQPGNSGGGAFDPEMRLAGMVLADDRVARALPIQTVIDMVKASNIPVALTLAPPAKPRVQLAPIAAESDGLALGLNAAMLRALTSEGLEPKCHLAGAYILSLDTRVWRRSGLQKVATIKASLSAPNKAVYDLGQEDIEFGLFSSADLPEDVEKKASDWAPQLVATLTRQIAQQNRFAAR